MFLSVGEPAPWFTAVSTTNPKYHFQSVAGRYVLLCFLKSANDQASRRILGDLARYRQVFDDEFCCFFGVSSDPEDQKLSRLKEQIPGIRFFLDLDQNISQKFGVIEADQYRQCTYIIDERLRIFGVIPFGSQPENHVAILMAILSRLPQIPPLQPASIQAPILVVPRIFEPELCQELIAYYHRYGGDESGFMREVEGRTIGIQDPSFKRRRDQNILDERLQKAAVFRIHDRLAPEIYKAFQFKATRIERHIVACYDSSSGG
ncbi:MAG: redoxin domain-containing protein, partial [Planktothrix sp.]